MARIDAAAIRDRPAVGRRRRRGRCRRRTRQACARGTRAACGCRRRHDGARSIHASRRWRCRTCSRTRRSTRRPTARSSSRPRGTGWIACLGHGPRSRARSERARSPLRAFLPRTHGSPGVIRHGDGALDHPRAAGGSRRAGLGRERAWRRREIYDRRARAGPRSHGGAVAMAARILIVDDEPNILGTVAPLLRARGYDVVSAMSGRAALEAVERDKPDLIVLDLGLPDIDGVEVCRQVRQTLSVPILVLSARGAEGDKVQRAGCRRRRLRDQAVRRRRAARAHPRRAAASRESLAAERADRARRPGDRPGTISRAQGRRGSAADAEGIRAADISGPASGTRADPSRHPQGRSGARTRSISRSTFGCSSASLRKKIEPNPSSPNTSSPSRGSATDSRIV